MYVCMYVATYVFLYARYVHTYVYMHVYTRVKRHWYNTLYLVYTYTHIRTYSCIHVTTDGDRLVSDAQTTISLSSVEKESSLSLWLTKETGNTSCRIVYLFFNNPITLSTCILTLDIFCDVSTSFWLSCFFPLVKDGISSFPP